MLKKIGFFHFGSDHSNPKVALECALKEAGDTEDALIVLPEAFNIAVHYRSEGKRNFDRTVLSDLMDLSRQFKIAFVAGLVIRERYGPTPPHSAACFVEGTRSTMMCYKIGPDDMDGVNYTACTGQADLKNPIEYEGVRIGALVCVDANPTASLGRVLFPRLRTVVSASDVVCVPSHMATGNFSNGKAGSESSLTSPWTNKRLILANSKPDGIASFITNGSGKILEPTVSGPQNRVVTLPFG
jgi:predicted amidohydrolase